MEVEQSGFRFEIAEVVEWQLSDGNPAFVFFLTITNLEPKRRTIEELKETYITNSREQLERNMWITGYLCPEGGRIEGNAHCKCGLAFYKSYLKRISPGDSFHIEAKVPDKAMAVSLRFEKSRHPGDLAWALCDVQIKEYEVRPTPRIASKTLTKSIERLEVFEERVRIVLNNLSVQVSDDYRSLRITGEIQSAGGPSLASDIKLVALAYDSEGGILGTVSKNIYARSFIGFDVFDETLYATDIGLLARRIRVFPKTD